MLIIQIVMHYYPLCNVQLNMSEILLVDSRFENLTTKHAVGSIWTTFVAHLCAQYF